MFQSKFFAIMIILTFVAIVATLVFQGLEMGEYDLFNTMFGSK